MVPHGAAGRKDSTFDGVAPMPWLKSAANWFPKTEEVQPDEIRVTFMAARRFRDQDRWAPRCTSSLATATTSSSTWDQARSPTTSRPACRSIV